MILVKTTFPKYWWEVNVRVNDSEEEISKVQPPSISDTVLFSARNRRRVRKRKMKKGKMRRRRRMWCGPRL